MKGHNYKNKPGGYYRGRSRTGRYYTRPSGCIVTLIVLVLIVVGIISFII